MPIKIELKDIPTVALGGATDLALIAYGYNGAARLLALSAFSSVGGARFQASDGNTYRLVGTVVDGQVMLGSEPV